MRSLPLAGWDIARPILTALLLGAAAWFYIGQRSPDFTVFYAAVTGWPGPVYDPSFMASLQGGKTYPWAYPPTFLLMLLPLRLLDLKAAFAVWTGLSGAAYFEASRLLVGKGAPLLILSPLYLLAAVNGQTAILIGALGVAGVAMRNRPVLAGALLAVAACIKPQLVLPLAPLGLLVAGRWRDLIAMGTTGAAICAASVLAFGVETWRAWIGGLPEFMEINDALGIPGLAPGSMALRIGLAAFSAVLVWRAFRARDPALQVLTAFGAVLTFSAHTMRYDLAPVAPAALALTLRSRWWAGLHILFLLRLLATWPLLIGYIAAAVMQAEAQRARRGEPWL